MRLFLATARDMGTLPTLLEECGYIRHGDQWTAPDFVAFERHSEVVAS